MARAKNRGYQQSFSPSYTIRRWRLGIYIRLSKEDLKKGKDDSNSVKNQRDLPQKLYGCIHAVYACLIFRQQKSKVSSGMFPWHLPCLKIKDLFHGKGTDKF